MSGRHRDHCVCFFRNHYPVWAVHHSRGVLPQKAMHQKPAGSIFNPSILTQQLIIHSMSRMATDEYEMLSLVSDWEQTCEVLSPITKLNGLWQPDYQCHLWGLDARATPWATCRSICFTPVTRRMKQRPEKRQECWHYAALAIKCSCEASWPSISKGQCWHWWVERGHRRVDRCMEDSKKGKKIYKIIEIIAL